MDKIMRNFLWEGSKYMWRAFPVLRGALKRKTDKVPLHALRKALGSLK